MWWGDGSSSTQGGGGACRAAASHGHPWRASTPGPGERGWAHSIEADQGSLVLRVFGFKESPGEGTHSWCAESAVLAMPAGAGEGGMLFSLPLGLIPPALCGGQQIAGVVWLSERAC